MRINPRSLALALAAGSLFSWLQPARAQIVGYVNVPLTNGLDFIANPLNYPDTNGVNNLRTLIPSAPNGTQIYLWDVTNQAFAPPATFLTANPGWDSNFDLPPGKGFVVFSSARWTNTFVGEVLNYSPNFIAGTNKFSLLACKTPLAGRLSAGLAFPEIDGANVYLFKSATQSYTDAFTRFSGYGWFDPQGVENTGGPNIKVAESFFVQNPGPDTNWVLGLHLFSAAAAIRSDSVVSTSTAPSVHSISLGGKKVTLKILNSGRGPYNVQFSSDGINWTTLATRQTGVAWRGSYLGGAQGYYRVTQSLSAKE